MRKRYMRSSEKAYLRGFNPACLQLCGIRISGEDDEFDWLFPVDSVCPLSEDEDYEEEDI